MSLDVPLPTVYMYTYSQMRRAPTRVVEDNNCILDRIVVDLSVEDL
jgi:hypothetical protein